MKTNPHHNFDSLPIHNNFEFTFLEYAVNPIIITTQLLKTQTNISEMIRWLTHEISPVELHLDETLPNINVEQNDLNLALKHIIINAQQAVQASKSGGIIISTGHDDAQIKIIIQDTGIGMSKDIQAHMFERFYRKDTAHSTRGLGLGLPIAKKVIELHGGYIESESEPNQGSVFTVTLPIHNNELH